MSSDLAIGVLEDRGEGVSDRDFVNSLARGLEVMRVFTRHKPKMTLSEVATATGMTRATARRFLLTLHKEGYVESNGRLFSLRPKVLELGFSVLSSMDIWQVAQPVMDELAERIQESVFAAVLDGDSVIYIARAASDRVISIGIHVGNRSPAYSVSTGRVLLAALPDEALHQYFQRVKLTAFTSNTVTSKARLRETIEETRRRGWSIVDEEQEIGLRSLSVPIRGRGGFTVAALNICCPTPRWTIEDMQARLVDELLDASAGITAGLDG
ncbi:MAG: helix-turn-helix domain-containing protein [Hyphomicrobiales bacterium]|nr:helix-turn-helix domain-containing protein [Hyphomicrobiales bacterium]